MQIIMRMTKTYLVTLPRRWKPMSVDEAPLWGGAGADEVDVTRSTPDGLVVPKGGPGAGVVGADAPDEAIRSTTGVGLPGPEGVPDPGPPMRSGALHAPVDEREAQPPNILRAAATKCAPPCAPESGTTSPESPGEAGSRTRRGILRSGGGGRERGRGQANCPGGGGPSGGGGNVPPAPPNSGGA